MPKKLWREDYHMAWVTPVSNLEPLRPRLMLDEEHKAPDYEMKYDNNVYTCVSIGGHNLVIATCPHGLEGNINVGRVAGPMSKTFSNLRMNLFVGVDGGVNGCKLKNPLESQPLRETLVSGASRDPFDHQKHGYLHNQTSWELDNCLQKTIIHFSASLSVYSLRYP